MFGAGTDYCLLLVARYRSSLRTSPAGPRSALAAALPLAGPAMIASALTVTGALLAMLAGISGIYRALGPVNAIGVVIVLVASLTLLPALLAVTGPPRSWRKDRRETRRRRARTLGPGRRGGSARGSALYLGGVVAALVVCALGLSLYHPNADILHVFRSQTDATRGATALLTALPARGRRPSTVVVERDERPAPPRRCRARLANDPSRPGRRRGHAGQPPFDRRARRRRSRSSSPTTPTARRRSTGCA